MSHAYKQNVNPPLSFVAAVTKHGDHWHLQPGIPWRCSIDEVTADHHEAVRMRLMEQGLAARVAE